MSWRVRARIWIGGELCRSQAHELVQAVNDAHVNIGKPGLEYVRCQPMSIEGLLEGASGNVLHFQSEWAPAGQLPQLTDICRKLGLTYRLWREPIEDEECQVEVWKPGMQQRLELRGDPFDPFIHLVEAVPVQLAINCLRVGRSKEALVLLERACPDVPEVPALTLTEE